MNIICTRCENVERTRPLLMINEGDIMGMMKMIAMMYEDGCSIEEIAEAANTKPSAIHAILQKRRDTYDRK